MRIRLLLSVITNSAGFWGLCGVFVYAATVLTRTLWGDNPAQGDGRKLAIAQFVIALIFGPVAAEGFGPTLCHWLTTVDPKAIFLTIGLAANYVWPIAVKALGGVVKRRIGGLEP